MFCPNCGTQLAENSKYCIRCGNALQNPAPPAIPPRQQLPVQTPSFYSPPAPANPMASAATIGGLSAMAGGGFVILGWATGGGLAILSLIFLGGSFLGLLTGMLADGGGGLIILLLTLALAAVVLIIPVMGFLCIRTGISLIEKRAYTNHHYLYQVKVELGELRNRVAVILGQFALIFVFTFFIPFIGTRMLGSGFYLAIFGAIIIFMGALFAQSQIGPEMPSTPRSTDSGQPQSLSAQNLQLSEQEKQALILLAQGMPSQDIAKEMGLRQSEADSLTENLLSKFGAANTFELVKFAQKKGHL